MKIFRRHWMIAILTALAVAAYAVFQLKGNDNPQYFTAKVDRGDISQVVEATGTINAVTTVQVGSQVSGTVSRLYADFNSRVKRGQVIAQIDPALFEGSLLQAKADLANAQASVATAKANFQKALALKVQTTGDYERAKALTAQRVMSTQQFDLAKANYDSAVAGASGADAQVKQAEAQVQQREAAVSVAQTNLDYTTIRAPIDGTVIARNMAHEIAHVAARHAMRQMTRGHFANIASIPLIFVGGGIGYAARSAAGIGVPMGFLKFSRGFEEEADYLGLQYMYKTGYDPQSFMSFFEKMQAREKVKPGAQSKIFASHPQMASRIVNTQKQIDTKLPPRAQYVVTRSEFDEVRVRLAVLENRHRVTDDKQETKPSLRRAPKATDDSNTEDDRPMLKRRDNRSD